MISRTVRYLVFSLELLVLFMLQQTPNLFPEIYGTRPILLLPAVFTIAMFEKEIPSMAFGIAGGLLLDFAAGGSVLGIHAIILSAITFFVSVISQSYMQPNFFTAVITSVWSVGLVVVLNWLIHFYIPGYQYPTQAFLYHYLPQYGYTILLFPLIYLMNRGIANAIKDPEG